MEDIIIGVVGIFGIAAIYGIIKMAFTYKLRRLYILHDIEIMEEHELTEEELEEVLRELDATDDKPKKQIKAKKPTTSKKGN